VQARFHQVGGWLDEGGAVLFPAWETFYVIVGSAELASHPLCTDSLEISPIFD